MADKAKADEKSERPALHPHRMKQAEYVYERWRMTVENGTTTEDLKRPAFYAHIAQHLRPGSIIEVMPDNRTFFAELLVLDAGPQYAKVHALRHVEIEALKMGGSVFPGYTVEFGGDHVKWRVLREADRKALKDGLPTQTDAFAWLANHLKAMAA